MARDTKRTAPEKIGLLKQKYLPWLLAIFVLTLIVYGPAFQADFNNWDDDVYVTQNELVQSISGENVKTMFSDYYAGLYQPLTLFSLAVDWQWGGGKPFAFHFTNILLHLLNTLLVFVIVKKLFKQQNMALLVALLFGIHTLHVESVAWITERKDVLYAFFYLLALWQYIVYVESKKWKHFAFALLLFGLSLLSKGMAVSLAITLIAVDLYLQRKGEIKKVILEKIPFLILAGLFGWIALNGQMQSTALNFENGQGPVRQTVFANYAFVNYLLKLIVPYNLSAIYTYPVQASETLGTIWAFVIIIPIVLWALWKTFRKQKILFFGLLFFLLNIVFVLQVLPVNNGFLADRFAYVASIGIFIMIAWTFTYYYDKKSSWKMGLTIVGGGYVLLLCVLTFQRNQVWENSMTLWNDVIEKGEGNYLAYNNRGLHKMETGDPVGAYEDFTKSLELDQTKAKTWYNRGTVYGATGRYDLAIRDFDKAIELFPEYADALSNRGLMKAYKGEDKAAIKDFDAALAINPNQQNALTSRGAASYNLKDYAVALPFLDRAITINNQEAMAFYLRAMCYFNLGQQGPGCSDMRIAAQLGFQGANAEYQNRCVSK